jgi:predicted RNase H-like HicB family nuclease
MKRRLESVEIQLAIEVLKKGNWYLARAPELDFVSQGKTPEEAKKNLFEVIRIQFKEMKGIGTLEEYLVECGFETKGDQVTPQSEIMGFERFMVMVP